MNSRACTIGILCPLARELSAVLASFDGGFETKYDETHETTYYRGKLVEQDVVAVCLPIGDIGRDTAGAQAALLKQRYPSLRLRFLVGIAGGTPDDRHDIRLGDVVIGTRIVNYQRGHQENGNLRHDDHLYDAPRALLDGLNHPTLRFQSNGRHLEEILSRMNANFRRHVANDKVSEDQWSRPEAGHDLLFRHDYSHKKSNASNCDACDTKKLLKRSPRGQELPEIHYGLLASADIVLRDGEARHNLKNHFREILAVEMEASALKVYEYIVVRGICDYADSHKNDGWQDYAAATAAACTRMLAESLSAVNPGVTRNGELGESNSVNRETREARGLPPPQPQQDISHDSSKISELGPEELPSPKTEETISNTERTGTRSSAGTLERTRVCSYMPVNVDLQKRHAKGRNKDFQDSLKECSLDLWYCKGRQLHQTHRRLEIVTSASDQTKKTSLWLPLANLLVRKDGSQLTMRFSDCNQLGWLNKYITLQGRNQYTAVYDPGTPNIKVKVEFHDDSKAKDFANKLLDSNQVMEVEPTTEFSTVDGKPARFYNIHQAGSRSPIHLVLATVSHHEYKKTSYQELVLCFIDDQLDFRTTSDEKAMEVMLERYLEAKYSPVAQISAYWPPDFVKIRRTVVR